jgi:excisionase family DNA binding protein
MTEPLPLAAASARLRGKPGRARGKPEPVARPVGLMSVADAARYLSVSEDTVRSLVAAGHLARVRLPCAERRLLVTRAALDILITRFTEKES